MTSPSGPITPSDIKNKLGSIQGEAVEQVENAKNQLLAVATVVGVLALLAAFLLGRRGGKRSSAVIEVRRG
jgi:predicted lysophospholipase L1 biosynthesis ABC-type transport system permease subunit